MKTSEADRRGSPSETIFHTAQDNNKSPVDIPAGDTHSFFNFSTRRVQLLKSGFKGISVLYHED